MAASSRRSSGPVLRSLSPSPTPSSCSPSSSSSSQFFHRSASPPRVNLFGVSSPSSAPSLRFSLDRPISPSRSISVSARNQVVKKKPTTAAAKQRRTCMCSPTTHRGSFRCSFHKNFNGHAVSFPSNRLNARRSAMTNSLVRIGTVEGDLVKRALAALIRPSSHQQRRREGFQPRPSRLSIMTKAEADS